MPTLTPVTLTDAWEDYRKRVLTLATDEQLHALERAFWVGAFETLRLQKAACADLPNRQAGEVMVNMQNEIIHAIYRMMPEFADPSLN